MKLLLLLGILPQRFKKPESKQTADGNQADRIVLLFMDVQYRNVVFSVWMKTTDNDSVDTERFKFIWINVDVEVYMTHQF